MSLRTDLTEVLKVEARLLSLQHVRMDMARLGHLYLGLAVVSALLVGIGRYWDNPRAELWQSLGLGSLAYLFVMAAFLWLLIWPLKPKHWSYRNVLAFVGMTSPPALIYAIPVERMLPTDGAQTINVLFLIVVSLWRVALLFLYLNRSTGLRGFALVTAGFLPLTLIVTALAALNLEHAVFNIMGGLAEPTANDAAYGLVLVLSFLSVFVGPVLLLLYLFVIWRGWRQAKSARNREAES